MTANRGIGRQAVLAGLSYARKKPEQNLLRLLHLVQKFDRKKTFENTYRNLEVMLNDPKNNWTRLILAALKELHPRVQEKFLLNFIFASGIEQVERREQMQKELGCNIPWTILFDPTSSCNLHCKGCWAAEYGTKCSMSMELMDRIVREGKELGIHLFIFSGGEPLIRKNDILTLCRKHGDCLFMAFSNGTLVDEDLAVQMQDAGNFSLALSVEGFEEATDMRRGQGTYAKVMDAMELLKKYGLPFGFSTCYHRYNTTMVGSDEFVDAMIDKGARFAWYFTYIPVGKDAVPDFMVTPDQREYMYHCVRKIRSTKPLFAMDFWNDGEYVQGCIAGGRDYLHINANGDVEPCAFIHYSNMNINDVSLKTALQQPLFLEYQKNQPFNGNHLRPCPLLDNPDCLKNMVQRSGACSTDLMAPEDICELTGKCREVSEQWGARADMLWSIAQGCSEKSLHKTGG